jgi:hypothetical protein
MKTIARLAGRFEPRLASSRTRVGLTLGLLLLLTACSKGGQDSSTISVQKAITLPPGFVEETVGGTWNQAVGLTFSADGRLYIWEKAGRVWRVDEAGNRLSPPLLDLSEEVGDWRDYGMLGFVLHPNFLSNGYVYALYVVDYHHLEHFGTPSYSPTTNEYFHDTIGRVVRYQARSSDGFASVDPASRRVLLGETTSTGCPILHQSHGVGSLVFGSDGTLLVSCGDGASYDVTDVGGDISGSSNTGLADGIIRAKEDVGALRAQLVDSLAGKVLRLDAATGDGIASNPFYDPAAPRSARSRVWTLGLRNPFRMSLRPDSGSHDPAAGDPGTLYIGDVGWNQWEELNVAAARGQNFGWPLFEGHTELASYRSPAVQNLDAPNPLFGTAGCARPNFLFTELLVQESQNPVAFPNPCNAAQAVPSSIPTFEHTRAVLDWRHGTTPFTRVPTYSATGAATVTRLSVAGSPVTGTEFYGNAALGGVWYTGTDFPATYANTYFFGDYVGGWIKNLVFDASDRLIAVRNFAPEESLDLVALGTDPVDGGLYYIDYTSTVRRIRFVGGENRPPIAVLESDVRYGPSPLQVQFNGTGSRDPELGPLTYSWDFGDGSPPVGGANPVHVFDAGGGSPRAYTVRLTVTDAANATGSTELAIVVNDTPPRVSISSPVSGGVFPVGVPFTTVPLVAVVEDSEQPVEALSCAWETRLRHNSHQHPEAPQQGCVQSSTVTPVSCSDETYYYEFVVQASDGIGLGATQSAVLYPDCVPSPIAPSGTTSRNPTYVFRAVLGADQYELRVDDATTLGRINAIYTAAALGCAASPECTVAPAEMLANGPASFRVRAHNPVDGWRAWSEGKTFVVSGPGDPPPVQANLAAVGQPIALITTPFGDGSTNLGTIKDGVKPAVGSSNNAQQYDTYTNGASRAQDWIGYSFTSSYEYDRVVLQEGKHFSDGGWFEALTVQVRQGSTWVTVSSSTITPAYPRNNGVNYETFSFTFSPIVGNGIRIFGTPGGSSFFVSVAELEVYGTPVTVANQPPIANAGPNQTVNVGASVTLTGAGSSDPNGNPITYRWAQIGGPAVTLSSTSSLTPTFTAPGTPTTLTFSLIVNDGGLDSLADSVDVVVNAAPPPVNLPPTANAGPNQTVNVGASVSLSSAGSADPEGSALSYRWTQIGGPAVTLTGGTTPSPTFTAPGAATTLTFTLIVNDGTQDSAADSVDVAVSTVPTSGPNLAPQGTPTAFITSPTGDGSRNRNVIKDGVKPAVGSTNPSQQYDTYAGGGARTSDWVGYTFSAQQTFHRVVFQEGMNFSDGGWFATLTVQVRQGTTWVNVSNLVVTPTYTGGNGVHYETFELRFSPIAGNGIRIQGTPGGSARFVSVAELEVYAPAP